MPTILSSRVYIRRWLGAAGLLAALAGCGSSTEPVPDSGTAYYPLAVGNYWVYAVRDSSWSVATPTNPRSVATDSSYQFRETITETFLDAANRPAYRLVRAKRKTATASWVNDSVFVVQALPSALTLTRGNARTVELVLPPRAGRAWSLNAFNNNFADTPGDTTRKYVQVGQPYTTGGGTSGIVATTYPNTVTTANIGTAAENNLLRRIGYQQVYAQGVGPVFRRREYFAFLNFVSPTPPYNQVFPPGAYTTGFVRRETLIETNVK